MKPRKNILAATFFTLLSSVAAWAIPASTETDLAIALEKAQKTKSSMLVEFTGSDWCPPCKHLRATVLDKPDFEKFLADKGLMFVELDYPRKEEALTPEVRKARDEVRFRYGVRGFPSVLLLDSAGNPYAVIVGPGKSPAHYYEQLEQALSVEKEFKTAVAAAMAQETGTPRAEALAAALSKLPPNFQVFQKDLIREIIAADPEDLLGFSKKMRDEALLVSQKKMISAFFEKMSGKNSAENLKSAREEALKILEDENLMPPIRLALYKFVSDGYAMSHDLEKALEYLKLARQADPESREGGALVPWISQMENIISSIKESEAKASK